MFTPRSLNPLLAPLRAVAARARSWSAESQQTARRNALVANTALAARRRDREDVEAWLVHPDQKPDPEADGPSRAVR